MLVYVAPVLDIGLYCHRLCDKSDSYKKEKKGDVITNMKDNSVRIDISYSCFIFLHSIIMAFQLTMKSILREILTQPESPDSSECQGIDKTIKVQVNPSHFDPFFPSQSIPDDVKTAVQQCWPRYTVILIS